MTELQADVSLSCRTMGKDTLDLSSQADLEMLVKTAEKKERCCKCCFTVFSLISRIHGIPSSYNWCGFFSILCKAVFHNPKVQRHFGRRHMIGLGGHMHAYTDHFSLGNC